jgi:hypothetical protein
VYARSADMMLPFYSVVTKAMMTPSIADFGQHDHAQIAVEQKYDHQTGTK